MHSLTGSSRAICSLSSISSFSSFLLQPSTDYAEVLFVLVEVVCINRSTHLLKLFCVICGWLYPKRSVVPQNAHVMVNAARRLFNPTPAKLQKSARSALGTVIAKRGAR